MQILFAVFDVFRDCEVAGESGHLAKMTPK
jgi:hypothetical protein